MFCLSLSFKRVSNDEFEEGEDGDTVGRDMDGWVETLGMGGWVGFLCLLSFCLFPLSFRLFSGEPGGSMGDFMVGWVETLRG